MGKFLMIDGHNLVYRCFFAVPELTRKDGFPTNALHGWVKSLWRLQDQERPEGMVVFFDLGGSEERSVLLPEYKAQRAEMPEALVKQVPLVKEAARLMGCEVVEERGVESDDLLAARAVALREAGHEVLIVSSDKDFAQVVGEGLEVLLPPPSANPKLGWRRMGVAGVVEKFGVPPERIVLYLALVGDASDNILGVPGVGPKTAGKWLEECGTVEELLARSGTLKPERLGAVLRENEELLRRNLKLVRLNLNAGGGRVEVPAKREVEVPKLLGFLEEYELTGAVREVRERFEQRELF